MKWAAFLDQLADWLTRRGLLERERCWVVGVSGGPDSVLLLHALCALNLQRELSWTLHAAHFHHGLRADEADADERFVAELAERLGTGYHHERDDIRQRTALEGGSTEEVARRARYEFLERVALNTGSELVAVGHHADDNAETVLHRICRGTGLRGLAGISDMRPIQPGSRVRLVRPFLPHRRSVIDELCAAQSIAARQDSTNATDEFTRGRIRNIALPLLRQTLNPNVSEALLRLAEQARWVGSYLEDAAARTFDSLLVDSEPGRLVINAPLLLGKHRAVQAEVIRRAVSLMTGSEQDLGFSHVEAVLRLAGDTASGKELHLPGSVVVGKRYDRLEFGPLEQAEPPPDLTPVLVNCPGITPLPLLGRELVAEIRDVDASKIEELRRSPKPNEEWLDYGKLKPPLVVRGRRTGERFHPLGAPGAKSISDFLIDEKVKPQQRERTGLLCDQDGPVWIMPLRIDERAKLSDDSRQALRLLLRPANSRQAGTP
ncbi:MAG: tRNA lysidine(34) synthetase TilS [Planctomycetota bacterium]